LPDKDVPAYVVAKRIGNDSSALGCYATHRDLTRPQQISLEALI